MVLKKSDRDYNYITVSRNYKTYRWYKPLLTGVLTLVLFYVFVSIISAIVSMQLMWANLEPSEYVIVDYDSLDAYSAAGAFLSIGSMAVLLPALFIAVLIVRDRPFSSYSSSRGGWNNRSFGWSLIVALVICAVEFIFMLVSNGGLKSGDILFDRTGFVVLTLLLPFQCIAEEYFFRGLVMQTFGAWFRKPVIAILLQAVIFTAVHPYNSYGMIAIFVCAVIYGTVVYKTKGLEATCAMHILTNFTAFYASGLGIDKITSKVDIISMIATIAMDSLFAFLVIMLGSKFGWFKTGHKKIRLIQINRIVPGKYHRKAPDE